MAKRETEETGIKKTKHGTFTRLSIKPFAATKLGELGELEITTDIAPPQAGRAPQAKTWFSGVLMSKPMSATDVVVWMAAMKAMQEEARQVAEKMKSK